jgi:uncharacterized damage-inducible protein DinB
MTLQEVKTLHAFNAWATNLFFDALAAIPSEDFTRDMRTSHGSLRGTLLHLVSAESTWLMRWLGKTDIRGLTEADTPTLADMKRIWEQTGFETAKFLGSMTDRRLQETFTMTTKAGLSFTHTYAQAFQHVVDHSTYHRGQMVAMLRQLGVTPPTTGLITFFRELQKKG